MMNLSKFVYSLSVFNQIPCGHRNARLHQISIQSLRNFSDQKGRETGKLHPTKRIPSSSVGVICPNRAVKGEPQHPRRLWQAPALKSILSLNRC
jgi:hypothetical protein